jgi:hypothetical protein
MELLVGLTAPVAAVLSVLLVTLAACPIPLLLT